MISILMYINNGGGKTHTISLTFAVKEGTYWSKMSPLDAFNIIVLCIPGLVLAFHTVYQWLGGHKKRVVTTHRAEHTALNDNFSHTFIPYWHCFHAYTPSFSIYAPCFHASGPYLHAQRTLIPCPQDTDTMPTRH